MIEVYNLCRIRVEQDDWVIVNSHGKTENNASFFALAASWFAPFSELAHI